jgi:hypothetical protein
MQIYNDFVILARDVSIDSKDKMLSIFKIIDRFNYPLQPEDFKKFSDETKTKAVMLPAQYVMTSSWSLDKPAKKQLKAVLESKIIDPLGKELGSSRNDVVFAVGSDRVRLNGVVDGIPVTINGKYTVELSIKDTSTNKILSSSSASYQVKVEEDNFAGSKK